MTEPKPQYATAADKEAAEMSDLERAFETHWRRFAPSGLPEPVREFHFYVNRNWSCDFAWPYPVKVAVELEGGTWTGGRHTRGDGFARDCEKYNAALALGWAVYRFTTDMLRDDPAACVRQVADAIVERMAV